MDDKDKVWERLNRVPRKGVMLSPGVYIRDMPEIEPELRQNMEAERVWQKISETNEQRNHRIFTEMFDDTGIVAKRLQAIREADVSKFKTTK